MTTKTKRKQVAANLQRALELAARDQVQLRSAPAAREERRQDRALDEDRHDGVRRGELLLCRTERRHLERRAMLEAAPTASWDNCVRTDCLGYHEEE